MRLQVRINADTTSEAPLRIISSGLRYDGPSQHPFRRKTQELWPGFYLWQKTDSYILFFLSELDNMSSLKVFFYSWLTLARVYSYTRPVSHLTPVESVALAGSGNEEIWFTPIKYDIQDVCWITFKKISFGLFPWWIRETNFMVLWHISSGMSSWAQHGGAVVCTAAS